MDTVSPREPPRIAFLPREMPLPVTVRPLREGPRSPRTGTTPPLASLRRLLILACTAAITTAGCYEMIRVLEVGGVTVLEGIVLALFVLLLAWVAFSFVSAVTGFFVLLFRLRDPLGIDRGADLPALHARVAMLLPTYNEDAGRVFARLQAVRESVAETGQAAHFDWFVLSDTTDPAIWVAEESRWLAMRQAGDGAQLYYRHRPHNVARKSGNVEDWVRRFGSGYDCMLILDADSLMTGEAIVRLAGAMERHAHVGLIQTLPLVVNARSRFARLQQFAGRLYGPVIAAGIAWWHGSEGNYWGHNAIIRVRAFAEHAGLPELQGPKPFGGHILSHDFVEAALMRRGGWAIHMAPALAGSYEEVPPSLLDFAIRDRRWCQGNLQHAAVLPARGLHWVSRLHFLTGIGAYLTAPLWLLFLLLGILISLQAQFVRPEYFPKGFSLFPRWPAQDPVLAAWVFAATMAMLIVPKLLAWLLLLTRPALRRQFGGALPALAGVLTETVVSGLMAPVMMVFQSRAVIEILWGRDAGWQVQRRDDGLLTRREIVRSHAMPTLFGLVMAGSAWAVSLPLLLWMLPVVLGLLLAIPVALLTSAASRTRWLWRTPEETTPPSILVRANDLSQQAAPPAGALQVLHDDPALLAAHLDNLVEPSRRRGEVDPRLAIARARIEDAGSFPEAAGFLASGEVFAVLNSRRTLAALLALGTQNVPQDVASRRGRA